MAVVFKNNAKTTLASGITSSATSITVADGSVFPTLSGSDTFFCTLDDGTNIEIVEVTAISSNTLTVTRAQDNTSATSFSTGTVAELRLTAGILNLFSQTGSDINAEVEAYLDANGTTFPDNVKAIFGTGSDFEIYHDQDGPSYIRDKGSSDLVFTSNGSGFVFKNDGETETLANMQLNGAVTLYYDNSPKIATTSTGIDVTGTVTADGLTVNSSTTNQVATFSSTDGTAFIKVSDNSTTASAHGYGANGNNLSLYANDSEKVRIQSAGNVNIKVGALEIGGTEVISSSRNLTNIGTISSGAIGVDGDITLTEGDKIKTSESSGGSHLLLRSDNLGVTNNSLSLIGVNDILIGAKSNQSGTGNIYFGYNAENKASGSGWVDTLTITESGNFEFNNGNFTEVGTISSGAITSSDSLTITGDNKQIKFTGTTGPFGLEFGDTENNPNFRLYYRTTPNTLTFENNGGNAKHTFDLSGNYTSVSDITSGGSVNVGTSLEMNGGVDNSINFAGTGSDTSQRKILYEASGHHYVTNRHGGGDLILMSNNGTNAGETTRITLKAGSGTQDIDITNANLDLNSNNINNAGTITNSGIQQFTKSVYGDFSTENFFRIKFQDQGGITNDVGIGQYQSGAMGFNVTQGQEFRFNEGTDGVVGVIGPNGVDARQGGFRIGTTTVIDSSRNLTNIGTISSGAITSSTSSTQNLDFILSNTTSGTSNRVRILTTASSQTWALENDQNLNIFKIRNTTSGNDVVLLNNNAPASALSINSSGATFAGNLSVEGTDVTITGNVIHAGDTDTYFGFHADNQWRFVGGNAEVLRLYQIAGATGVLQVAGAGSATYPNFTFNGDTNTGMYSSSADSLSFTTGGTAALTLNSSQNATFAGTITSGKIEGTTADANGHILKTDSSTANASDVALQIRNSSTDYNLKFQPRLPAGNMHAGVNTDDFGIFTSNAKGISIGNNDKSLVVIHPTDGLEFWTNNARRFNLDTSGNIQVNGTTVIDGSRNISNVGSITASGDIISRRSAYPGGRLFLGRPASAGGDMTSAEIHFEAYGNNTTLRTFGKIEGRNTGYDDGEIRFYTESNGTLSEALILSDNKLARFYGNVHIGQSDSSGGVLALEGNGTGSAEGGEIQLKLAADYDGTYDHYRIDTYQDDLRIGRAGTTDLYLFQDGKFKVGNAFEVDGTSTFGQNVTIENNASLQMDGAGDFVMNRTDNGFSFVTSSSMQSNSRDVLFQAAGGGTSSVNFKVLHSNIVLGGTTEIDATNPQLTFRPDDGILFRLRVDESANRLEIGHSSNKNLYLSNTGNASFNYDLTVQGDLVVNGTTTTLNTATLDVEDKNITLNYSTGDSSGSANGAGITIQDAVNSTTDATMLWNTSNNQFDFSHGLNVTGVVNSSGNLRAGNGATTGNLQLTSSSYQISGGSGVGDLRFVAPRFRFYEGSVAGNPELEIDGGNTTINGALVVNKASESLANQPSIAATFDSTSTDGLALISVEHLTNSTAAAMGAGIRMKTGDGSTGSAKKNAYIFLKGGGYTDVKYIAPYDHTFYVDAHDNSLEGTSYNDLGTLAMTVKDQGSVLIGKTVVDNTTDGIRLDGTNKFVSFVRTGGEPLLLNRKTSDGTLITFRKDNANVGVISTESGRLNIGTGDAGIAFIENQDRVIPRLTSGGNADASIDLGDSSSRFRNLHLSGTISSGAITSTGVSSFGSGTTVGSVELDGSSIGISEAGILFQPNSAYRCIHPTSMTSTPHSSDISLGWSNNKWKDIYLAGYVKADSGYQIGTTTVIDSSRNLTNLGTISSGAISSEASTHYLGGIKIAAENSAQNYIAFAGTTGDNPGSYNHSYIGERIYSGTERSELLLIKLNDVEGSSGSDRIRHIANNHVFDTYTSAVSIGSEAALSTASSAGTFTTRMTIDQDGDVILSNSSRLKGATFYEALNGGNTDATATSPRFYSPSSGKGALSAGGAARLEFDSGAVTVGATNGRLNLTSATYSFGTSFWAGTSGYPGYQFTGGNTRFGFSSTTGVVDVYTDGNFYATDAAYRVWHANDFSSTNISNWNTAYSNASQALGTSSSPTFATVNTGQGATEVHLMNQNVRTTDSPTFNGLSTNSDITFNNSGTTKRGIRGTMGDNDMWFIGGGATASNAGYLEIATGDDGQTSGSAEYMYFSQYGPGSPWSGTLYRRHAMFDLNGQSVWNISRTPSNNTAILGDSSIVINTRNGSHNYIQFRNDVDDGTHAGLIFTDNNHGGSVLFTNHSATENSAGRADTLHLSGYQGVDIRAGTAASNIPANKTRIARFTTSSVTLDKNTSVSGTLSCTGNLTVSSSNTTGGGIILSDDGDIVDLNDAYCSMRFSYGVRVFSANGGGSAVIALKNDGQIIANSNITAYGSASDIRLKENIETIQNPIDKVQKLRGVTFDYKKDGSRSTGLIAQELEEVLPEVVYETVDADNDDNKYKAVRYGNIVGLLVEAIKEQQEQIESLKSEINNLKGE